MVSISLVPESFAHDVCAPTRLPDGLLIGKVVMNSLKSLIMLSSVPIRCHLLGLVLVTRKSWTDLHPGANKEGDNPPRPDPQRAMDDHHWP